MIKFGEKAQERKDAIEPWRVELRIDDIKRYADSALYDYKHARTKEALEHLYAVGTTLSMLINDLLKLKM